MHTICYYLVNRFCLLTFFGGDTMKIAICDDEKIYIDSIVKHLDYFSVESKIEFEKYIFTDSIDMLKKMEKFDIAILDVEMDNVDGIKLGEVLRKQNPHIILIYITAHKKYLDDALNLNAVRFFEKPLDSQRFYRGLRDAITRIDNSTIEVYLKEQNITKRISAQDIIFIEIEKRKSKVVTPNKEYHSEYHINFWREKLKDTVFVSPHKSYIINLNYVTEYERNYIVLNGKYKVSIARNKQSDFHQRFMQYVEGK